MIFKYLSERKQRARRMNKACQEVADAFAAEQKENHGNMYVGDTKPVGKRDGAPANRVDHYYDTASGKIYRWQKDDWVHVTANNATAAEMTFLKFVANLRAGTL